MGILYLLIGLLYFYISLYLFNFGKKTQFALRSNDSETLTGGLENLKSFFKVSGIVTAIFIGLYAFTFVFGLLFAGLAVMK
jgi:hypothetical protein